MAQHAIQLVGLIGWPVEHSVSPAMHNAAFQALGLPWHYGLLPTDPAELETRLCTLEGQGYQGVNVTVPHKQAVMSHLDEISGAAKAIGAVNTIVVRDGRLFGHNTDGAGFLAALREAGFEPVAQRAILLGAGGAARSVAYVLAEAGCHVTLYTRTTQRARNLAQELGEAGFELSMTPTLSQLDLASFDLLVNATSVGTWPQTDATPWPVAIPLPSHWTVYDLVYNPPETRLLTRARAAGATAIGGLAMLVHQGALAFELWTGQQPPIDVMRTAAEKALCHRA
jgi:shikimate dehydrogenase